MGVAALEPVIALRSVSFAYDGSRVLEEVDLKIAAGEVACLIGPNGGGKTTLLKILLGLLRPTGGDVRVFGLAPERARARIGYLPQRSDLDRDFPVTVLDVVLMGRLNRRLGRSYASTDRRMALSALEEMELTRFASHPFARLSGGQQQRVLIARAVCGEPDLLLLDEPTAHVDALTGRRLLDGLQVLSRRMTIVLVSHDLGFVSPVIDTVVCVNRRVRVHPASELTGEHIRQTYGADICMVLHDREVGHGEAAGRCPEESRGDD